MKIHTVVAGVVLATAAVSAVPASASADPEFPRNGVIPPGTYHVVRHPSNVVGSPYEGCDLQVFLDRKTVVMVCGERGDAGQQTPAGPDETHITFQTTPIGLDLRDIDPRQGLWSGIPEISGTPLALPYPLGGISLTRR